MKAFDSCWKICRDSVRLWCQADVQDGVADSEARAALLTMYDSDRTSGTAVMKPGSKPNRGSTCQQGYPGQVLRLRTVSSDAPMGPKLMTLRTAA